MNLWNRGMRDIGGLPARVAISRILIPITVLTVMLILIVPVVTAQSRQATLTEVTRLTDTGNSVSLLELPAGIYRFQLKPPGERTESYYEGDCVDQGVDNDFARFLCPVIEFRTTSFDVGYEVDCVAEHLDDRERYTDALNEWNARSLAYSVWQAGGRQGVEPPQPGDRPDRPRFDCARETKARYATYETSVDILGKDWGAASLAGPADKLIRVGEDGLSPGHQAAHVKSHGKWTLTIERVGFPAQAAGDT